jgi:hypothetical protein
MIDSIISDIYSFILKNNHIKKNGDEFDEEILRIFINTNTVPFKLILMAIDKAEMTSVLSLNDKDKSYEILERRLIEEIRDLDINEYKLEILRKKLKYIIDLVKSSESDSLESSSTESTESTEYPEYVSPENIPKYLNIFNGYLRLCYCKSFNQYDIRFRSGRSRLFTVIGEYHMPVLEQKKYIDDCKGNFMIDDYVNLVNNNKGDKILHVYMELSPILHMKYNSNNLYRLLELKDFLIKNGINPPLYNNVDLRYIDNNFNYSFITNILNNLDNITIGDLRREQTIDSHFRTKIMPILKNLITKSGKYRLEETYEPEHFLFLQNYYEKIEQVFNDIEPKLEMIKKYPDNVLVIKIISDPNIRDIVDKYFYVIASVVDYYAFLQVFRRDYYADEIIFLVGNDHALQILDEFKSIENIHNRKYHIYEGINELFNGIDTVNISGSFY